MNQTIEQWNAAVYEQTAFMKVDLPHTLRPTTVSNGVISSCGIKLEFEGGTTKYLAFLLEVAPGDICIEYAYYTPLTGVKYLDKKRVKLDTSYGGHINTAVSTAPLKNALDKIKDHKPQIPTEQALDLLEKYLELFFHRVNDTRALIA